MANVFAFRGARPVIDATSYVHPNASVIGQVVIGARCYIGPGASLRGDFGGIELADGCNVQDNAVIHMFPGVTVTLARDVHVGHGAIIHGGAIGEDTLIGMNAVLMDEVVIGAGCVIGAHAFVAQGTRIADRKLAVGSPARVVKDVSDELLAWKRTGTALYHRLAADSLATLVACEPLRDRAQQQRIADEPAHRPRTSER